MSNHARENAEAGLKNIVAMVTRLEHARECNGEDCDEWLEVYEPMSEGIGIADFHDVEDAEQRIQEDPLSIQVRSGWVAPGKDMTAEEFEILLTTGGPALRILGDLDYHGQPTRCWMEYQDWGTPWTEFRVTGSAYAAMLTYCQQFYYGG